MGQLLVFLPAVLVLLFVACSIRLAARLLGLKNVHWKLCFLFALVLFVIALARSASGIVLSAHMSRLAAIVIGMGFSAVIGACFFGRYVVDPAGLALGWKGGAKLTACAFLIVCAPAGVFVAIGSMVR